MLKELDVRQWDEPLFIDRDIVRFSLASEGTKVSLRGFHTLLSLIV